MKDFRDERVKNLEAVQKVATETYLAWKEGERLWDEKMKQETARFGAPFWGVESEEDEE